MATTNRIEREVAAARIRVENDIEELERRLVAKKTAAADSMKEAAVIASGSIALGLIVAFGGKRAIKWLVGLGLPVGAALLVAASEREAAVQTAEPVRDRGFH